MSSTKLPEIEFTLEEEKEYEEEGYDSGQLRVLKRYKELENENGALFQRVVMMLNVHQMYSYHHKLHKNDFKTLVVDVMRFVEDSNK